MVDIIKTGLGISRTIRNMGRFRQILNVLARNGLEDLIHQSGVLKLVPDMVLPSSSVTKLSQKAPPETWAKWLGRNLRASFEELGPGFVKLGQILSSREDLFPKEFLQELRLLQDQVKGIAFEEAMAVLRESLARPIKEVFLEIKEKPIGTASIGVVYEAQLRAGEMVVIKIRRPEILKHLEADFNIFTIIVKQIERISKELQYLNLSRIIESFAESLTRELDFNVERFNAEKLAKIYRSYDKEGILVCPKIFAPFCSDRVLVMERLDGIPFTQIPDIKERVIELQPRFYSIVTIIFQSIFAEGFFHGDPHGGNLLLLEDNRIGVLDFGLCGTVSRNGALSLISMLHALSRGDFENMVYELLDVAEFDEMPDTIELVYDAKEGLGPYIGLNLQDIDSATVFQKILTILAKHRVYLPRDWLMIIRSVITLDGLGKSLEIDLDIFLIVQEVSQSVTSRFFSRENILEEGYWLSRNLFSTMRIIPRHLKWYLKEFASRQYGFEVIHRGLDQPSLQLKNGLVFLGHCFISGSLYLSGSLLAPKGVFALQHPPPLVMVIWGLATIVLMRALYLIR